MYCRKCGKQIDDGSKFCPYCGGGVKEVSEDEWDDEWQEDTLTETGQEKKSLKKWLIPVGVMAGIAVVSTIGVLAMNLSKSEPTNNQTVTEQKESESNSEASESKGGTEKAVYPKEITLESDVQSKVTEFISLLGNVDCKMCGGDGKTLGERRITQTIGKTDFGYNFLFMSLYNGIPFIDGEKVQNSSGSFAWQVSEEIVNDYLQNSINTTDYKKQFDTQSPPFKVEQGTVYFAPFDPNSMWTVEQPQINKVVSVSDKEIQIDGSIRYTYMEGDVVDNEFQITLTANPNSMWGGYTLKEINSWGEGTATTGDYVLPDIATRYYSENELSSMDAHTLYLARNELYARHGYIFNNADLKSYFGAKSWYEATTTNVPDSEFNQYEKANLDLIIAVEEKLQ